VIETLALTEAQVNHLTRGIVLIVYRSGNVDDTGAGSESSDYLLDSSVPHYGRLLSRYNNISCYLTITLHTLKAEFDHKVVPDIIHVVPFQNPR
jgi:hypothetical protein